jgi:hypothetical protein
LSEFADGIVVEDLTEDAGLASRFKGHSTRLRMTENESSEFVTDDRSEDIQNLVIFDLTSLRSFAKHIVTTSGFNPAAFIDDYHEPEVRTWKFEFDFPQAQPADYQQRRQKHLSQPFLDLWWGGFHDLSISGALDENLAGTFARSVQLNKWSSENVYLQHLDSALEAGRVAQLAGRTIEAADCWAAAFQLVRITTCSLQGRMFFARGRGLDYDRHFHKVQFQLHSSLAAQHLTWAKNSWQLHSTETQSLEDLAAAHRLASKAIEKGIVFGY